MLYREDASVRTPDLVPGGAGPATHELFDIAFADEEGQQRYSGRW